MKFFISSREFKRLLIFMPLGWVTLRVTQPKDINRYGEG